MSKCGIDNKNFKEEDDQFSSEVQHNINPKQMVDILDEESQLPLEVKGNSYKLSTTDLNTEKSNENDDDHDYSLISLIPQLQSLKKIFYRFSEKNDGGWWVRMGVTATLVILYIIYFYTVIAVHTKIQEEDYWCSGDGLLIIITVVTVLCILYFKVLKPFFGAAIIKKLEPVNHFTNLLCKKRFLGKPLAPIMISVLLYGALLIFLLIDTTGERHRLISLFGLLLQLFFGFIFSKAPQKVKWQQILWGIGLQFAFGLLILRWSVGKAIFNCAGDKVSTFLAFSNDGSSFLFGNLLTKENPIFAFTALPVIFFVSFIVQILYFYGAMQWFVIKLGWCLQVTIGTTAGESVNAAANIFLGMTTAPLLIKPYLKDMTKSELHAVMTGGFATVAGSVLAAYISFGVDASHLLSASVISAPAALASAKLFYPETKVSKTGVKDIKIEKGTEANWLHAGMVGVADAIYLTANVGASLIAFIAAISFFNSIFNWFCILAGAQDGTCSLENIFGYIFMPLAWTLGVDWEDSTAVGQLIGIKTMVNEFVAYSELRKMVNQGILNRRSEVIATYALCGFSNLGSMGIMLGGFSAMIPERHKDLAQVVVRAMVAGSSACFLTACVAGVLLSDGK